MSAYTHLTTAGRWPKVILHTDRQTYGLSLRTLAGEERDASSDRYEPAEVPGGGAGGGAQAVRGGQAPGGVGAQDGPKRRGAVARAGGGVGGRRRGGDPRLDRR